MTADEYDEEPCLCGTDFTCLANPPHNSYVPANRAGSNKGEENGKQGGVHSERAREVAEGPDQRGLLAGSGVLARAGSGPQGGVADGAGRGLSESPGDRDRSPGDTLARHGELSTFDALARLLDARARERAAIRAALAAYAATAYGATR